MYSYLECQELIEKRISEIDYNKKPAELYDPIKYILSIGGKRLRPCLTLMANNLFCDEVDSAIEPAIGLEVFHNFTLLHDDIMDNATMRRNHKTVHTKWDNNTAILSGDAMMILAYEYIARSPKELFHEVFQVFNQTALEVCEGQQYDMNFENIDNVTEDEYLEMIRLKTAVLISTSFAIGGIIAKTTPDNIKKLYNIGSNIGLAFQVQDDYLDTFGDAGKFGKSIGGDIISNKKTYLLISALNSGNKQSVIKLKNWISMTEFDPEEKINAITEIYKLLNIPEKTQTTIDFYFNKSIESLDKIDISTERKEILKKLMYKMMKREN